MIDVSIVLATKGRPHLLDEMLSSLERCIEDKSYEIIVITGDDDSSSSVNVLQKYNIPAFKESIVLGGGRHSWPQLYNFGFSQAKGKWAMFASDDIVFGEQCISAAVDALNECGDDVAGGIFYYMNVAGNEKWKVFGIDFTYGGKLLLNYGLVRLDMFREVGGLDESYKFYCADGDLCLKLYERGKRFIPLSQCAVVHNNISDETKRVNRDSIQSDIDLYVRRWEHFVGAEIPQPLRLFLEKG